MSLMLFISTRPSYAEGFGKPAAVRTAKPALLYSAASRRDHEVTSGSTDAAGGGLLTCLGAFGASDALSLGGG